MSVDDAGGFAPPPLKPAEALIALKRTLRDLRTLSERGAGFELKGQAVLDLAAEADHIAARLVKRPGRSPEWERFTLKASPDVRRFVDEVKKRLARWAHDDDR